MIAALFVEKDGVYSGLPDVEVWDKARDARTYAGPHPVVAHPPCERLAMWLDWRAAHYWGNGEPRDDPEYAPWEEQSERRKRALRRMATDILSGKWRGEVIGETLNTPLTNSQRVE